MKASFSGVASALLALSVVAPAVAENKRAVDVFKRVEKLKPKYEERSAAPAAPKLAKRASPFLNNATESMFFSEP